jgi:hypothetical protein
MNQDNIKEEFDLSKKIINSDKWVGGLCVPVMYIQEFIRLLKDRMKKRQQDPDYDFFEDDDLFEIDKLAGEKL